MFITEQDVIYMNDDVMEADKNFCKELVENWGVGVLKPIMSLPLFGSEMSPMTPRRGDHANDDLDAGLVAV